MLYCLHNIPMWVLRLVESEILTLSFSYKMGCDNCYVWIAGRKEILAHRFRRTIHQPTNQPTKQPASQLWHQNPRTQDHEYQSMPMCIIPSQFYPLIYIRSILILSSQLLHVHHIPDCLPAQILHVLLVSFSPCLLHLTVPAVPQGQHTSHSSLLHCSIHHPSHIRISP
jgi:hypothetical protein